MNVQQRLAANVRRLRREKGLSQERFALDYGFDRTYISGIERAVRNPTILVVEKLASALEVSIEVLVAEPPPEDH